MAGDGGNEVGMGKVYPQLISSTITNAALIGCVVPTDHLLVCSVSNWGGYALAAATAAMDIVLNSPGQIKFVIYKYIFNFVLMICMTPVSHI